MSSEYLENRVYELLNRHLSHRPFHIRRLASVCTGMQLARTTQLSKVASWVRKETQQNSREQFLKRFLMSPYFSQEAAYQPLLTAALSSYKAPQWHLILDRTNLDKHRLDLLMVSLAFRKRAIPLGWEVRGFGGTGSQTQIRLLKRVAGLIPADQRVIVHGDIEFGSVPMMAYIRSHSNWDFILAQKKHTYFQTADETWHYLADLPIKPRQPIYQSDLTWTKKHHYKSVNLFAFHSPHQNSSSSSKYEVHYCTTSLPIAHTLRRLGRRRWGIECMFRDFKSSGWHIDQSGLLHPDNTETLLVLLSINYLWATCLGRWLCKSGRRSEVDAKKSVILAFSGSALIGSLISTLSLALSLLISIFTIDLLSHFLRILLNGREIELVPNQPKMLVNYRSTLIIYIHSKLNSRAFATASVRLRTPSLPLILTVCRFTVLTAMNKRLAIS